MIKSGKAKDMLRASCFFFLAPTASLSCEDIYKFTAFSSTSSRAFLLLMLSLSALPLFFPRRPFFPRHTAARPRALHASAERRVAAYVGAVRYIKT